MAGSRRRFPRELLTPKKAGPLTVMGIRLAKPWAPIERVRASLANPPPLRDINA
jgi:hypothetical protein